MIKSKVLTDNEIGRMEGFGIDPRHVIAIGPEKMVPIHGTTTLRTEFWRVFYIGGK